MRSGPEFEDKPAYAECTHCRTVFNENSQRVILMGWPVCKKCLLKAVKLKAVRNSDTTGK